MSRNNAQKAQVTLEYTIIVGFLIALTVGILGALSLRLTQVDKDQKQNNVVHLQNLILKEIERANTVEEGYSRIFELPKTVGGYNYTMTFDADKLLVVKYRETESYVFMNASGNICITSLSSSFRVKVQKSGNSTFTNTTFSSCPECTTTFDVCNAAQQAGTSGRVSTTECCNNRCRCCI